MSWLPAGITGITVWLNWDYCMAYGGYKYAD